MSKKIISTLLLMLLVVNSCTTTLGFSYPEPDWGALLREKQQMVSETDFELYAEAPIDTAEFYGAKFEPVGGAYIGTIYRSAQGKYLPVSVYHTSIDEMNESDLYYPDNERVIQDDVIAMVGWTIYDLANVNYDHVRKTLDNLSKYNRPMFIRFANEMNCSQLGDDPYKYVEVFRKVADMIHEYPNFAVVWSPIDLGSLDQPFEYFYPGDEYVDWIGISNYEIKYFQGNPNTEYKSTVYFMTGNYSWATNRVKPIIEFVRKNNIRKPIMISEGGVSTSNIHDGVDLNWAASRLRNKLWYLIMKYPEIKGVVYFDVLRNYEKEKFDISGYPSMVDIFKEARDSGAYKRTYSTDAEFVFKKANDTGTITASGNVIPLYTLAYFENMPEITVNYHLDGTWIHSSSQIPYKCNFDISGVSDGNHTLTISSGNTSKEYVLYKKGSSIRFGAEPDSVAGNRTGNVTANVYSTDIIAYVDNHAINSYNIGGKTVISLEDLRAYGFNVEWNGEARTLSVTRGDKPSSYPDLSIEKQDPGNVVGNVYSTDIRVYMFGEEYAYESYNIGGVTCVAIEELGTSRYNMSFEWNGEERKVYLFTK